MFCGWGEGNITKNAWLGWWWGYVVVGKVILERMPGWGGVGAGGFCDWGEGSITKNAWLGWGGGGASVVGGEDIITKNV